MSGVIAAVVAVATEVAAAVTAVAEAVAGAVMAGAEALGVVGGVAECTAVEATLTGAISGAVEGSIYGAAFGAITTPITGGDLGENMLFGGLTGGLGGAASPFVSGALRDVGLATMSGPGKYVARGLSGAVGGALGSSSMGKDPLLPTLGGLASGAVDYVAEGLPQTGSKGLNAALSFGEKQALSTGVMTGLSDLFASSPTQSSQTAGGSYYPTSAGSVSTSASTTGQGVSPGSSALAQVLRTDAGAPVFGSSDKEGDKGKSGWNIESLRYMGSEA